MSAISIHKDSIPCVSQPFKHKEMRYVRVPSAEKGRAGTKLQLQEVDPEKDIRNQCTIDDFALENIISVGATHMLRPVDTMTTGDVDLLSNGVESLIASQNGNE